MKLQDVKTGQRVAYEYPGDTARPGTVTQATVPGGMISVLLDDGVPVTTRPDMFRLLDDSAG